LRRGAKNAIGSFTRDYPQLVASTTMWEIETNSVGSGSDPGIVGPGQVRFVGSPPPPSPTTNHHHHHQPVPRGVDKPTAPRRQNSHREEEGRPIGGELSGNWTQSSGPRGPCGWPFGRDAVSHVSTGAAKLGSSLRWCDRLSQAAVGRSGSRVAVNGLLGGDCSGCHSSMARVRRRRGRRRTIPAASAASWRRRIPTDWLQCLPSSAATFDLPSTSSIDQR
jgi:hypothetical protein